MFTKSRLCSRIDCFVRIFKSSLTAVLEQVTGLLEYLNFKVWIISQDIVKLIASQGILIQNAAIMCIQLKFLKNHPIMLS